MSAGQHLRRLRENLGLTIREVEESSATIAERRGSGDYTVSLSRLSDFETKDIVPSIYKLYSLSVIYRTDFREILKFYGLDLDTAQEDHAASAPGSTHLIGQANDLENVSLPVRFDPAFDARHTTDLGRMIEQWGVVPVSFLRQHAASRFVYGYVGSDDLTMFPVIMPGAFLQVDESLNQVASGGWTSEYLRPIYFIETREGYVCSWCALHGDQLILQPHPLSPVAPRVLKHMEEAEIVGQVVGVAMRLASAPKATPPAP